MNIQTSEVYFGFRKNLIAFLFYNTLDDVHDCVIHVVKISNSTKLLSRLKSLVMFEGALDDHQLTLDSTTATPAFSSGDEPASPVPITMGSVSVGFDIESALDPKKLHMLSQIEDRVP